MADRYESVDYGRGYKDGLDHAANQALWMAEEVPWWKRGTKSMLTLYSSIVGHRTSIDPGERMRKLCPCGYRNECVMHCNHERPDLGCPPWPEDA